MYHSRTVTDHAHREKREQPVPLLLTGGMRYGVAPITLVVLAEFGAGLSAPNRLIALSTLLVAYAGIEILYERYQRPDSWFIAPPTLTSVASFVIPFGLTNGIFYGTIYKDYFFRKGIDFGWINKAVSLAVLGLMCLWVGYRWSLGRRIGKNIMAWVSRWGILNTSYRPVYAVVVLLFLMSTIAKYLMVRSGVFGIMSIADIPSQISRYIHWIRGVGTIVLLVVSIDYFSTEKRRGLKGCLLILVLANEIFWGFLSAFKGQVVFPIVVVAIGYATARRRIPKVAILAFLVMTFFAYSVVEPFRRAIGDRAFDPTSLNSAVMMLADVATGDSRYAQESTQYGKNTPGTLMQVSSRANQTSVAAISIWYEDEENPRPEVEKAGPTLKSIFTSPIRAVIPRLLWPNKPTVATIGEWFRIHPFGGPVEGSNTSVGMSMIGYLYIAGGVGAIIVCFLILGVIQRSVFSAFLSARGGGTLLVYIGLLSVFVKLPTAFDFVIIDIIRLAPLIIILQFFLFKG